MLTERTKNFIEKVAFDMQKNLEIGIPNKYSVKNIIDFVKSMGCSVKFEAERNVYSVVENKNVISLAFHEDYEENVEDNVVLKVLFHEVWHFISDKIFNNPLQATDVYEYNDVSFNTKEASANYFSRAMLLPEKEFVKSVIDNVDSKGMCNIFSVAKQFNVSYMDVIARGNDLSLWNKKGGV